MNSVKALLLTESSRNEKLLAESLHNSQDSISLSSESEITNVLKQLANQSFDIIVLDMELAREQVSDAFHVIRNYTSGFVPIVCLWSENGEPSCDFRPDGFLKFIDGKLYNVKQILEQTIKCHCLSLELTTLREEQEQYSKMATLGMVTANIAHEINNPLTIIMANVDRLINKKFSDKEEEKYIKKVSEQIFMMTTRLAKIVKGLNSYSRKSLEEPSGFYHWPSLVEESVDLCRMQIENHGVEFVVEKLPDVEVKCRELQLSQVLLNLLNNARDAAIETSEKWIRISSEVKEGKLLLYVVDSGRIESSKKCESLFKPFYTTKKNTGGTGLGLSLSRTIIRGHQGDLCLLPERQNTTFCISLPLTM